MDDLSELDDLEYLVELSEEETMLETLLTLLRIDAPAPEILLEEDGDICLDWPIDASISISSSGKVNWAVLKERRHGTDLNEFIKILEDRRR